MQKDVNEERDGSWMPYEKEGVPNIKDRLKEGTEMNMGEVNKRSDQAEVLWHIERRDGSGKWIHVESSLTGITSQA